MPTRLIHALLSAALVAIGVSLAAAHGAADDTRMEAPAGAVPLLEDDTSCSCRKLECPAGTHRSCAVTCSAPRTAVCSCDAECTSDGKKSGANSCLCE